MAHMWMVLLVQVEQSVESIALLLMGSTSDRQAGQWNVPSGRERISGWPHSSQACSPSASGRAAICSSVPTVTSSKVRLQDSHSAERENSPRLRSAPCPHAGQTRRSALETLVCPTEPLPVLVLPGVARARLTAPALQRGAYVGIGRATSPAKVFHPGDSADGSYPLTTPIQPVASLR